MRNNLFLTTSFSLFLSVISICSTQSATAANNNPEVYMDVKRVAAGEEFTIYYRNVPVGVSAWVGIYRSGTGPEYGNGSTLWQYTQDANGSMNFILSDVDQYTVILFSDGTNSKPYPNRIGFFVGGMASFSTDKLIYEKGEQIKVSYSSAPALKNDWIGIYPMGANPSAQGVSATAWKYLGNSTPAGSLDLSTGVGDDKILEAGSYFISYFVCGSYVEPFGRKYFMVGEGITGIDEVNDDDVIYYDNARKCLLITTTEKGTVSVFAADGRKLEQHVLESGRRDVLLNCGRQRFVVVTWRGDSGKSITRKVIL